MTDRLRAKLAEMLREHKAVVTALKRLTAAAKREKKSVHARFAEKLMLHAKTEEVLYPAAILVGEQTGGNNYVQAFPWLRMR